MQNFHQALPATRREFLTWGGRGIGLLAFSQFAPSFLVESTLAATPAPEKDRSILVLVQLAGGNDGLNTVIPYEDSEYYRLRPTLGIKKEDALHLNDTLGLHPSLSAMHTLMQEGHAGVIQNVGYPNPNHSHFRSSEIWETGSDSNQFLPSGWIGRFLDNDCGGAPGTAGTGGDPVAVHVSNELPQSFLSGKPHATFGLRGGGRGSNKENLAFLEKLVNQDDHEANANASFLRATMMDALVTEQRVQKVINNYKAESVYPGNGFAAGMSTRVYFVSLGGFDTHSNQANNHANLLRTLSEGLAAFQKDLVAKKLDSQVLTMTFSEFGRRPNENESRGTDHGTAAPLFVMGSQIKGNLHGTPPSLANLPRNRDIEFSTDFRQVYATVLDKWFSAPTDLILGKAYTPLPFI
jgi:uncharacterized protein (DUF1501 family)